MRDTKDVDPSLLAVEMFLTFPKGLVKSPMEYHTPLYDKGYKLCGVRYTIMDIGVEQSCTARI